MKLPDIIRHVRCAATGGPKALAGLIVAVRRLYLECQKLQIENEGLQREMRHLFEERKHYRRQYEEQLDMNNRLLCRGFQYEAKGQVRFEPVPGKFTSEMDLLRVRQYGRKRHTVCVNYDVDAWVHQEKWGNHGMRFLESITRSLAVHVWIATLDINDPARAQQERARLEHWKRKA